jgi:hypothetical protein
VDAANIFVIVITAIVVRLLNTHVLAAAPFLFAVLGVVHGGGACAGAPVPRAVRPARTGSQPAGIETVRWVVSEGERARRGLSRREALVLGVGAFAVAAWRRARDRHCVGGGSSLGRGQQEAGSIPVSRRPPWANSTQPVRWRCCRRAR